MLLSIMGTPNAVVIAVIVMLALSLSRIHVVLSLAIGAFVGGLVAGMPLAYRLYPDDCAAVAAGI